MHICVHARASIHVCIQTRMHASMHACMRVRPWKHACMHSCVVHMCIHANIHSCICSAYVHSCKHAFMQTCLHTCIHLQVCMCTCVHLHMQSRLLTCMMREMWCLVCWERDKERAWSNKRMMSLNSWSLWTIVLERHLQNYAIFNVMIFFLWSWNSLFFWIKEFLKSNTWNLWFFKCAPF